MSSSRHKRHFSALDERYLIETIGDARRACTQAAGKIEINSDLYRAVLRLTEAMDDVVVATGRPRDHFWLKPHSVSQST